MAEPLGGTSLPPLRVDCRQPWLELDLGAPHRVLSWAVHRPGLVTARHVLWREVRDVDLPPERDPAAWLADELRRRRRLRAVGMLTARKVTRWTMAETQVGAVTACAVATVGLGNAERIGAPAGTTPPARLGTINIALRLDAPLTPPALLEAMSLVASARTAAMIAHGPERDGGPATGTGTDCIAVAAPLPGAIPPLPHAGLHTDAGRAIGRAAHQALCAGILGWMAEFGPGAARG